MDEHRRFWLLKKKQILLRLIISRRLARRTRTTWAKKIFRQRESHGAFYTLIPRMQHIDVLSFQDYLKVTPAQLDEIVNQVSPMLLKQDTNFRRAVTPKEKVCLTLRFLTSGDSMRSLSLQFRLGFSTTSVIIGETCAALWASLSPHLMKSPANEIEWKKIANDFQERCKFPHCLGAIGGKHIKVQAPNNAGSLYHNENSENDVCVVVTVMCDANCLFRVINIGDYEHRTDAGVWELSEFGKALASGKISLPINENLPGLDVNLPYVFITDGMFSLKKYMLCPYSDKEVNTVRRIFNYRLNRAQRVSENSFGMLIARWAVLRKPILAKPSTVDNIIKACCMLHNYIMTENNDFIPDYDNAEGFVPGNWRTEMHYPDSALQPLSCESEQNSVCATAIRDNFANYFVSNVGMKDVPWQYDQITNEKT